MDKIKLAKDYSIDAREYANRGNAILGIRNSGKSYTAMKIAEDLLSAGIPIMAFDPIGIWRNLKIGVDGNKGFPIVVAGGNDPDLPLTVDNVKDLVRAAMKENISLIFDLYSVELANKSTWIKIVQESIHILMYENKSLRHIFLEEAAEFIPQRLQPQHSRVYSEIERLARMGRNSKLGYTLINQRAEEVNKAILEISEASFLHKQVGKNSLLSIKKWMDVSGQEYNSEVINKLPQLAQGACFVVGDGELRLIKVLKRKTFHPSPEKPDIKNEPAAKKIDVSKFVANMQEALNKKTKDEKLVNAIFGLKPKGKEAKPIAVDPFRIIEHAKIQDENKSLRAKLNQAQRDLSGNHKSLVNALKQVYSAKEVLIKSIDKLNSICNDQVELASKMGLKPITVAVKTMSSNIKASPQLAGFITSGGNENIRIGSSGSGVMRMLKAAALYDVITKQRMGIIAGLSHSSGSFSTYLSELKGRGWIEGSGNEYRITEEGIKAAGPVDKLPKDPERLVSFWCSILGENGGSSRMLTALFRSHPSGLSKNSLGQCVGLSPDSGTFSTYLSKLSSQGLIKKVGQEIFISEELFS